MTEIQKLNDFLHSRLRTEMYLSSRDPHTQIVLEYENGRPVAKETTWVPALFTAFREVMDNALDELITHKSGDRLDITFDPKTLTIIIEDNGRGIPIGFDAAHNQYSATMALTETKAGRNFSDDRGASRGLNGVGASIVNFCSEWFTVDIRREGKHFSQRFAEGKDDLIIEPAIILPVKAKFKAETGTKVEFKLSPKVFHNMTLPESFIKSRVIEVSLCYPNLKIYYNGQLIQAKKGGVEKTLFPNFNSIFIEMNNLSEKPMSVDSAWPKFHGKFWLVPDFFEEDSLVTDFSHSLVNSIPTFNGGTHIDAFRRTFFSGLLLALEKESKKRKLSPNRSDVIDRLLLYSIIEMDAPSFDSQSKTRLINEDVAKIIKKELDDPEFFKTIIKKNPIWIDKIYERCAERTQKKDGDELKKLAKKGKAARVLKLKDATGNDRSKCILFLCEGDSAISGLNESRNADIHGGLPLRGKVLNVHGMTPKQIYENEALLQIINSIGLIPGQRANRHILRYGKVYITTDADADGQNITALLTNFFYTMWPELFDSLNPFIYVFETPLIIAVKSKLRKYWYADEYETFNQDELKGWDITRAKGLASLKKEDWKYVLTNPKIMPLTDDGEMKEALNLLFNSKLADSRKDWIGL